ncbi:MAG: chemotaxis protein CheW [Victivallales bacterium]|nr:chemotaxis protein CheW [Victivallales bacterium]
MKPRPEHGDCWNLIGTMAPDGAGCPRLTELVHCRNCPYFQQQSRRLLETPPPPGYLRQWGEAVAAEREAPGPHSAALLVFRLEQEWLALPAATIGRVGLPAPVHRLPFKSDAVLLGLVNIDGHLQLLFSLKKQLGIESAATPLTPPLFGARLVEAETNGFAWAFVADEVAEVRCYDLRTAGNIPPTIAGLPTDYIREIFSDAGRTVGVLDDELLVGGWQRRLS